MWSSFCPQKKHVTVRTHTHTSTLQKTAQISALTDPRDNMSLLTALRHTLLFLWLKGVDSNIRHWLDSNQVKVQISLALDPLLRQSKQSPSLKPNMSQSSWNVPPVLLSHSLHMKPRILSVLNLQRLSHSLDWGVGGRRHSGLAVAEHIVNPSWWSIIPGADLKSTTPPALSLLAFMETHFVFSLHMELRLSWGS